MALERIRRTGITRRRRELGIREELADVTRDAGEFAGEVGQALDDILRTVGGTTLKEAGVALAVCDAIAPLLIRVPDLRARALGVGIRAICRFRRGVRRRT